MLNVFRQNNPYVLIFIPITVIILLMLNVFFPYHLPEPEISFGLWGKFEGESAAVNALFSGAIVTVSAMLINGLFNRNEFSEKINFLPSILYVTYLSFFHSFYFIDGLVITQLFLILLIRQLMRLRQKDDGRKTVFNAGFMFGVACTFFPLLVFGFPFVFLIIWVSRPFILRESTLTLVGVALPIIYAFLYAAFFQVNISIEDFNSSSSEVFIIDMWLIIGSLFLFFFMGIGTLLSTMTSSSIRLKKMFRMILLMAVFTFGLFLLDALAYKNIQVFSLFFVPVTFVLPYAFGESKINTGASVIFYILIFFTLTKFFVPFGSFIF